MGGTHVEESERVDQLAAERQDRRAEHAGHLLEHRRAALSLGADGPQRVLRDGPQSFHGIVDVGVQGQQHARDLIAHLGGVAVAAHVDGHERDEVALRALPRDRPSKRRSAPLVVAMTKSVTDAP